MLRRIFLLLMIITFMFGACYSFAETEEAYEYGFYEITNKKIVSQDEKKFVISFEITNKTDNYYPKLFVLPTLKANGDGKLKSFYIPYYEYEATEFSLEPKESKYISINCELPNRLPNKNLMISLQIESITHRVSLKNESIYLNKINPDFEGFIEGSIFAYWELSDGSIVRSNSGPNVEISNLPKVSIDLKSTFNEKKKVYPQYIIYERSPIYNSKPIYSNYGEEIIFNPNEEKTIVLDVPKFTKPESYVMTLNFVDELGTPVSYTYDYRYVIKGESAKISKITFEETSGKKVVKSYIYGPADGSEIENVTVEMTAYDLNNTLLCKNKETVKLGKESAIAFLVLKNINSTEILVEVKVISNNKELCTATEKLSLNVQKVEQKAFLDIIGKDCEEAVKTLNGLGIINGYPDNTFKPNNLVTRAEFSTIATKLLELEVDYNAASLFTDIDNHWGKPYINTIYKNGLVSGYPDGSFRPQNNVTYAEAITILLNSLGYRADVNKSDVVWPYNYLNKASEIGLINGMNLESYMVPANRGDIAILTLKAYLLK